MKQYNAHLLAEKNLTLGEGAIWDEKRRVFFYVDIKENLVGCVDPHTHVSKEVHVGKNVGTVVLTDEGTLIVALQGSIETLDFDTGILTPLTVIEPGITTNRCNDGKCDAAGRLWIGTMDLLAAPRKGALYSYDGQLSQKLSGITVSNGICWSLDNTVMYYIDSFDYNVKAYHFHLATGEISNESIIITFNPGEQTPDGMCIDAAGMLWIAIWGSGEVHRHNPVSGELLAKVAVDAPNVSSCAFGGKNMRQLFITTAREDMSKEALAKDPLSGSLFIADTDCAGVISNRFKISR